MEPPEVEVSPEEDSFLGEPAVVPAGLFDPRRFRTLSELELLVALVSSNLVSNSKRSDKKTTNFN